MTILNVYECRRWKLDGDSWLGALIVAAPNPEEARALCAYIEGWRIFSNIVLWPGVQAEGKPRILYDDYMR